MSLEPSKYSLPPQAPRPVRNDSTVILGAVGIVALGMLIVVALAITRPDLDLLVVGIPIIGMAAAFAGTLLALLKVGDVQKDIGELKINVDGRLTSLLEESTKAASLEATTVAERIARIEAAEVSAKTAAATLEASKVTTQAALDAAGRANQALAPSIETTTAALDANTQATEANTSKKASEK